MQFLIRSKLTRKEKMTLKTFRINHNTNNVMWFARSIAKNTLATHGNLKSKAKIIENS